MIERTKSGVMFRIEPLFNCGIGNGAWGVYKGGTELVNIFTIYDETNNDLQRAVDWIHSQD